MLDFKNVEFLLYLYGESGVLEFGKLKVGILLMLAIGKLGFGVFVRCWERDWRGSFG